MENVEDMLESILWFLLGQGELLNEGILSDSVWLGHNEVVSVRVEIESILEEIL